MPDQRLTSSPSVSAAATRRTLIMLSVFGALLVACYYPMLTMTGKLLVESDDMAHGFFAPIVALYIAWGLRDYLVHPPSSPSLWSFAFIGFAALLGTIATLGNSATFARFAFLISLSGCLLAAGGWKTLRRFSFPLALLLFTFPVPDVLYGQITQPLQLLATRLSEFLLESLGLSVLREGNVLQLAYMKLSVVEACSGLRSLITLFFFCLVYSYFFETGMWLRIGIVSLAIPTAIAINGIRITTTGVLGKYNMAWTEGTVHEVVGWAAFVLGFLFVLGCHQAIRYWLKSKRKVAP